MTANAATRCHKGRISHIKPSDRVSASGLVKGPDGNLWFTDRSDRIGNVTLNGKVSILTSLSNAALANAIVVGPDNNLWFAFSQGGWRIERLTLSGKFDQFPVPDAGGQVNGIAVGADGNLWLAQAPDSPKGNIGRVTVTGEFTEFPIPTAYSHAGGIAAGPDGNLWFTEYQNGAASRYLPRISLQQCTVVFAGLIAFAP